MPTNLTSKEASQSLSSNSPLVVVANSRISWWRASFSSGILTHAVTELLCTSSIRRIARRSFPHLSPFGRVPCSHLVARRSLFSKESGVRALARQQFGVPEAPASHCVERALTL